MRRMFETQIYDLSERLVSTEARWRDVNHLLISAQRTAETPAFSPRKVPLTNFLRSMGLREEDLKVDDDFVFVLTPFHPDYDATYSRIQSVCARLGLRCLRGDEEYVESDLLSHILRLIVRARVVVANINGRNPNVFYELGVANALDKSTLLISQSLESVPFDLRTRQIVIYNDLSQLDNSLRDALARVLAKP